MEELKSRIAEYRSKWQVFGGKGQLVDIFELMAFEIESLWIQNKTLNESLQSVTIQQARPNIEASEIRDKLHSLVGVEQLNGDYIQNIKTNLSDTYFEKVTIEGVEVITLKPEVIKTLEFIKEGI